MSACEKETCCVVTANPARKTYGPKNSGVLRSRLIPKDILENEKLNKAIERLPQNYNFEIHKTIWRIKSTNAKKVALQFPEGLLMFSMTIADIIEEFTEAITFIMGDVTYGACCIDDFTARGLDCDFMVHYGHSCLVPIEKTKGLNMLYIFVTIDLDTNHFVQCVLKNFDSEKHLAFVSTIQFLNSIHSCRDIFTNRGFKVTIPQAKPLSPGEILGCTSPKLPKDVDVLIYLGDGRFHMESVMIANPEIAAYKYDPYSKEITREYYDTEKMHEIRQKAIKLASQSKTIGVIQGTLGRQGSRPVTEYLREKIQDSGRKCVMVLLAELFPYKLKEFNHVDAWVQVACPRLSIDWGSSFEKPVLTPYELSVALECVAWQDQYPMDYYANNSLGQWTVNNAENRKSTVKKK